MEVWIDGVSDEQSVDERRPRRPLLSKDLRCPFFLTLQESRSPSDKLRTPHLYSEGDRQNVHNWRKERIGSLSLTSPSQP